MIVLYALAFTPTSLSISQLMVDNDDYDGKSYIEGWNNIDDFRLDISLRHL